MGTIDGYYMHPTLHGERVVFVCETALWEVPLEGGVARRLTTAPGAATTPVFSPDGASIAYAARDEGPQEVFVMPSDGGPSRRVTWLGTMNTQPAAWSEDGKRVVVRSNAERPFLSQQWLYEVSPGGHPKRLAYGPARMIGREPGGKGVVLGINSGDPARWKRYRGGTAGRLLVDRKGDGDFKPLVTLEGNLAAPMWIGKRIYFLSDHEGHGNLYSCTPTGRSLTRHTDHEDYYARFPSTDGSRIVYHAGADLYVFDPATDETRRIDVALHSGRQGRQRRFVSATRHLEDAQLSPSADRLAAVVRGGAYTAALWEGATMRHGAVSSERRRLTRWLDDGKRIVSVSDLKGEEGLVVEKADGSGRAKHIKVDIGRPLEMLASPKGADRVAISNQRQEVLIVDLAKGTRTKVEASAFDRIGGMAWSPDGRWLAYGIHVTEQASSIHLYDTRAKRVHEITRPDFLDYGPSFDPDGKYLYFLSHRVFDPVYDNQYFDLGFPRGIQPCLVTLAKDTPSPFSDANREAKPLVGGNGGAKGGGNNGNGKGKDDVTIQLAGIADRVVTFPVPEQRYVRIQGAKGRALFTHLPVRGFLNAGNWSSNGGPGAAQVLESHVFATGKTETVISGITDFEVTSGGQAMLVRVGNRLRALSATAGSKEIPAASESGRASGWLDLERLRVAVEPGLEWGQMFDEAWRLQRDQFWVADMTQVDWKAVHRRYRPLVDRVATRAEFSDLMWEMQGELGTSHNYEMGGDYTPPPGWYQGLLGADIGWSSRRKRWVVEAIPQGDSWDPAAASPLTQPGVGIKVGDEILAVNGRACNAHTSPAMHLVNEARNAVELKVRSGSRTRTVTVQTLATDQMLRYRDWVEGNRAKVHKASRGKVGYVHVPNMGPWGFSEFHRYFKQEVAKPGLIIDVRYNGGGHVSQLLLQMLRRKRIGYGYSRYMGVETYPRHAPAGPMVCLTNEFAGSDGDMFSHGFKLYGLGPLIGMRTWGGVVGIWPRHALVDGTVTTQSEFAHFFVDVGWGLENYGTDPDIVVDILPADWAKGRDPQLDRGLVEVQKILRREKPEIPDMRVRPDLRAPKLPRRS